jgi:hypothetical protein
MNSSTSVTEKSNGQNCSVKKSLDLQIDEAQKLVIQELRKMNADKQAEIDRLNEVALNKSLQFERMKTQVNVLSGFLDQFLSDYEGMFDHEGRPTSIEMAENFYLPAAKYMADHFGRTKGHRIESIQEWIDKQ